jgi:hypothetical protein
MELEQLKQIWTKQEEKIDRNWQLNIEILRNTNLDKAKSKMNNLTWVTAITLSFYLLMALFFLIFTLKNSETLHFALSGGVLTIWSLLISTGAIKQLNLIQKIDYADPIPVLQKKLETLKLIILKYVRLAQWIIPLYLAFVVFWFKILFNFDIIANAGKNWLIVQVIISMLFIPLSIWIYQKLHPKNISKKWINTIMKGAGSQISDALDFIDHIERFEKIR